MTVAGLVGFAVIAVLILAFTFAFAFSFDGVWRKVGSILAGVAVCMAIFIGMRWYYANTASGQRALVDQKSNFNNGLERTVTVYTANGDVIAQYTGEIDIEGNDGGYVLFDFEGRRYTYYNCFVESIATIGG